MPRKDLTPAFIDSSVREPRREQSLSASRATQPQQRMRALWEKNDTQAISTGAGFTVIVFSVFIVDNAGLFDPNRYTIPDVGKIAAAWLIFGQITWAGDNAGTRRQLRLRKNGATALRTIEMQPVANIQSQQLVYMINDPSPGDYYELVASHDAGHNVNVIPDGQFGIIHQW